MRAWIKFACVVLAWTILSAVVLLAGPGRPDHQVQVSTRTTSISFSSPTQAATAARVTTAARATTTTSAPARTYAVQRGDTLSAIAARFGVRGGWPALYAANRSVIGPDPNVLGVGVVLHLPGPAAPVRYTVTAGDTLSAIASRFAVQGGWPALYAANRSAIGANPNALNTGTRLTIPTPSATGSAPGSPAPSGAAPSGTVPGSPQPHSTPAAPSSPPAAPPAAHQPQPRPHASSGMPSWLKIMLLAVGLLAALVFAAEPLLARRRRRRRGVIAVPTTTGPVPQLGPVAPPDPGPAPQTGPNQAVPHQASPHQTSPAPEITVMPVSAHEGRIEPARIVMADHDRVVVTRSKRDDTICVLRPPGEDPADILRVARLVLPEGHYGKLAEQLGMPANWPMNQ